MRCLFITILALAACSGVNSNRAALVPRATPRMTTGQPSSGIAQLDVGASSVASLSDPQPGGGTGLEIPGTQLHGGLKLQPTDRVSIGVIYENGLAQGATPLREGQPAVDNGNVEGYGLAVDVVLPVSERFTIGLGADVVRWSIPWSAFCDSGNCAPNTILLQGDDSVLTFAASVTPSFKLRPRLNLFGGLTVRQHPMFDEPFLMGGSFSRDELRGGPGNLIVSAGLEYAILQGKLLTSAVAYWDFSGTPVEYGPGVGVMLSVPLGKRKQ